MKSKAKDKTIVLDSLSIGYRERSGAERCVVPNINATIYSGELTSLLGANGVGKSTLLRTMTANQPKLSGEVYYLGRELSSYTQKELSKMISIVLTERVTIKNISVFELVSFGRSPYTGFWGGVSEADRKIVEESLQLVGIEHLANRMVQTLSDGERQKAMIAKALAQQTPIVLLDEPTAFLDFPSKVDIMQLLHRLSRQTQKTIFMSTHDLDLALQISDQIWLMDGDRGVNAGIPEDLALDGSLGNFFERKGIAFDSQTGLFRVDNAHTLEVELISKGGTHAESMVRKALRRSGIATKSELEDAAYRVSIIDQQMFVTLRSGEQIECSNIEEILNVVVP
ncbi:MAG: ABC transporter ATP-binding protein [Rikenellaceae bacterium]